MNVYLKTDPVLSILHGLSDSFDRLYCFPSQERIMELLIKFRDTKIAIATLNRWLRAAEDLKYIKRTRRTRRDKKLGMVFQSTLYRITYKGYQRLKRIGMDVIKQIEKLTKVRPKRKKESPRKNNNHFLGEVNGKVRDLALGAIKKVIY